MIGYLFPRAVYDMSHLICYNEFQILRSEFISYEETVFDLDCTDHVIVKHLLLLLLLLAMLLLLLLRMLLRMLLLMLLLMRNTRWVRGGERVRRRPCCRVVLGLGLLRRRLL